MLLLGIARESKFILEVTKLRAELCDGKRLQESLDEGQKKAFGATGGTL